MDQQKNNTITIAIITTVISFALFVFAIKIIYNANIDMGNMLAYLIASAVFGGLAAMFTRFRYRLGLWVYLAGLVFGFVVMINTFNQKLDGWADLVAVVSLFMIAAIGLGAGLLVVLIQYLMNRKK